MWEVIYFHIDMQQCHRKIFSFVHFETKLKKRVTHNESEFDIFHTLFTNERTKFFAKLTKLLDFATSRVSLWDKIHWLNFTVWVGVITIRSSIFINITLSASEKVIYTVFEYFVICKITLITLSGAVDNTSKYTAKYWGTKNRSYFRFIMKDTNCRSIILTEIILSHVFNYSVDPSVSEINWWMVISRY